MKQISELERMLNHHFKWNKARMGCFVRLRYHQRDWLTGTIGMRIQNPSH